MMSSEIVSASQKSVVTHKIEIDQFDHVDI